MHLIIRHVDEKEELNYSALCFGFGVSKISSGDGASWWCDYFKIIAVLFRDYCTYDILRCLKICNVLLIKIKRSEYLVTQLRIRDSDQVIIAVAHDHHDILNIIAIASYTYACTLTVILLINNVVKKQISYTCQQIV